MMATFDTPLDFARGFGKTGQARAAVSTCSLLLVFRNLDRQGGRLLLLYLRVCRFRQAECSRAVVAFVFDVIILWQLRHQGRRSAELAQLLQHNLGPPVVFFEIAVNLDHAVLELANVANVLQMPRKDDDGEGADSKVFAEVEECNATSAGLDAKHRSRNALGLADV